MVGKKRAHQLSDLWDIHRLGSGVGLWVVQRDKRPVYQLAFELEQGVREYQADAEITATYHAVVSFLSQLAPGWRARFIHRIDCNLKHVLDQYDDELRKTTTEHGKFFCEEAQAHLRGLIERRSVIRRGVFLVLSIDPERLEAKAMAFVEKAFLRVSDFFWTAFGGASQFEQQSAEAWKKQTRELDALAANLGQRLRRAGLKARALTPEEGWQLIYGSNHPNTAKALGTAAYPYQWRQERSGVNKVAFPSYETPREVALGQEPQLAPDHVVIDGQYLAVVTARNKPKRGTFPLLIAGLSGFNFDHEIVVDVVVEDPGKGKRSLTLLENSTTANINTSTNIQDVVAAERLQEIQDAKVRMDGARESFTTVGLAVRVRVEAETDKSSAEECHQAALKKLSDCARQVETAMSSMSEMSGLRERNLAWRLWQQTAPESAAPIQRRKRHSSSRAALLVPINTPRKGDKRPMATFLTPQGDLYNFDLYDGSNPNFNLTVVGTSGCGKSAMYSQILCGTLSMNALVTITDVGMDAGSGSYRSLCSLVGGDYCSFATGRVAINPLELPLDLVPGEFDESDFGDPTDPYAPLMPAQVFTLCNQFALAQLITMVSGGRERDDEPFIISQLTRALTDFYRDEQIRRRILLAHAGGVNSRAWCHYPTLSDFTQFLRNDEEHDKITECASILQNFYCEGLAGAIFNRPSNFDLDSDFVVFDLKNVPDSLFETVAVSSYGAASRRSYRRSDRPKVNAVDEAGVLFKRRIIAKQIEEGFSTSRKSNAANVLIAQDLGQLMNNEFFAGVRANCHNILIGYTKSDSHDIVERELRIPPEIVAELASPSFERDRLGGFTNWLHCKGSGNYERLLCKPPISLLWLVATDPKEMPIRQEYIQKVGNPYLALRLLAADYPQMAEGGKQNYYLEQFLAKKQEALRA